MMRLLTFFQWKTRPTVIRQTKENKQIDKKNNQKVFTIEQGLLQYRKSKFSKDPYLAL